MSLINKFKEFSRTKIKIFKEHCVNTQEAPKYQNQESTPGIKRVYLYNPP